MPTQLFFNDSILSTNDTKTTLQQKSFFPLIVGYKDEIENKLESIDIDIDTCTNYIL